MDILTAINNVRRGRGLHELRRDGRLADAATGHALFLASGAGDLDNSHVGAGGSSVTGRVAAAGYQAVTVREITGWGWGSWDENSQMDYWLNSPAHRDIIYHGDLTEAGAAYVYQPGGAYTSFWVVVFAVPVASQRPMPAPPPTAEPLDPVVYVPVVVGPPVAPPTGFALIDYLRGDGRAYMVQHPDGNSEKFRTVDLGFGKWLQLKNNQWEEFWIADGYIWRGVDTSPGEGHYYRQFEDGHTGARWCPARMSIGESWSAPVQHTVQTYRKDDCQPVDHHRNGRATNQLTLAARYDRMTFGGVTVDDVIELRSHTGEGMFFARGWGLVAWRSAWGSSEIAHVLPAHEADNEPEWGCFGP